MTYYPEHQVELEDNNGGCIVGTALFLIDIDNAPFSKPDVIYAMLHGVLVGDFLITANVLTEMFGKEVIKGLEETAMDNISSTLAQGGWPEDISFKSETLAIAAE